MSRKKTVTPEQRRERHREYQRKWRQNLSPEKLKQLRAKTSQCQKEYIRSEQGKQKRAQWRINNRDKIRQYDREYYRKDVAERTVYNFQLTNKKVRSFYCYFCYTQFSKITITVDGVDVILDSSTETKYLQPVKKRIIYSLSQTRLDNTYRTAEELRYLKDGTELSYESIILYLAILIHLRLVKQQDSKYRLYKADCCT